VRLGLPPEAFVVGLFSQLVEHKGALDFVRAAATVAERNPDVHFLIAGDGPEGFAFRLDAEIDRGRSAGRVRRVPPQPEIWSLLSAVDLVALTTLWPDPLPRVIMEAMAAGRPVVAYDGGGVPEMLVDGECGVIARRGDWKSLAQGILRIVEDPALQRIFGAAGIERAERLFSVDGHVEKMERELEAAASTQG
jgi:glycosyltransferase involved in cell wall biosynthesis